MIIIIQNYLILKNLNNINMEYYFLAHTGRSPTYERTTAINSTNSFITFTEYNKTMHINVHIWIVKALKLMKKEVRAYVSGDVNSINNLKFNKALKTNIIKLVEKDNIDALIQSSQKNKKNIKLSIRDIFIYNHYNDINSGKIKSGDRRLVEFLDILIIECINALYIKSGKNINGFFSKSYNKRDLVDFIIGDNKFTGIFESLWDDSIKNIYILNPLTDMSILDDMKKSYSLLYNNFIKDTPFLHIFQAYTNIDVKLYKKGQTMPNLKFEFNGIFQHLNYSSIHKMGLYSFDVNYNNIVNIRTGKLIPKYIENMDDKDIILNDVNIIKKDMLKDSLFPIEEDCLPILVGKQNMIMLCPSNMQTLLNHIEDINIVDSIFYLFGCSAQPEKKIKTPELEEQIRISRQLSIEGQLDFNKMRDELQKNKILDEKGNIIKVEPESVITDEEDPLIDIQQKYLKYKMKYLRLKKLL